MNDQKNTLIFFKERQYECVLFKYIYAFEYKQKLIKFLQIKCEHERIIFLNECFKH